MLDNVGIVELLSLYVTPFVHDVYYFVHEHE
jgi:hypothetical protein